MSWCNLKSFCIPVFDYNGEPVAFFKSKSRAEEFCTAANKGTNSGLHFYTGDYIDIDVDVTVRGS